jgi:peptidoglycan/LPS O-acetylase OafA/YrhL
MIGGADALSPAVAPPPGNPRFPLFDALRGIAVLAVLVFHSFLLTGALNRPVVGDVALQLGALGPIVFFVISGFLLYRPWVAARAGSAPAPGTERYGARRALRILPAYWFALTVLAVFPGIVGVFTGDWWRYYLFLQLYSDETLARGLPVAWTLCVEVAFYVCLPIWALMLRRVRVGAGARGWLRAELWALALVATGALAVQVAASRQLVSHLVAQTLLGQAVWMALGMALAVASVAAAQPGDAFARLRRRVVERPGPCWAGAAVATGALALVHGDVDGLLGLVASLRAEQPLPETLAGIALTAAASVLLVLPAVFGTGAGGLPRRVLAFGPLVWLGVVSYGVYLWHLTIAELLALPEMPAQFSADGLNLVGRLPFAVTPILFALTLALSCAVAALSYRFVERPFLRRKAR